MIVLLLAAAQLSPSWEPLPGSMEKRNGRWEAGIRVRTSLPEGTRVQVQVLPRRLRFTEETKALAWVEQLEGATLRRAFVRGGRIEIREVLSPSARRAVRFRAEGGSTYRMPFLPATVGKRVGETVRELRRALRLKAELESILGRLQGRPRDSSALVRRLLRLRERCRGESATVDFLDRVAADAVSYGSWAISRKEKKAVIEKDPYTGQTLADRRSVADESFALHRRRLQAIGELAVSEAALILSLEVGRRIDDFLRTGVADSEAIRALRLLYGMIPPSKDGGIGESIRLLARAEAGDRTVLEDLKKYRAGLRQGGRSS